MPDKPVITVRSRKYDGSVNRQWKCELVANNIDEIVLKGVFDSDVVHTDLGHIDAGTVSYEYFWKTRCYNVFRFHEPSGSLRNYYCNISEPPTWNEDSLDYVDLDIDVIVWPSGEYQVLDLGEFRENSIRYGYSEQVIARVNAALSEVLTMIRDSRLPN
jgi:uncharacterized protein